MSTPKGGRKILKRKSSWHRRRRSKILAVSLKHYKRRREGGRGSKGREVGGSGAVPPLLLRCTAVLIHHCTPPAPVIKHQNNVKHADPCCCGLFQGERPLPTQCALPVVFSASIQMHLRLVLSSEPRTVAATGQPCRAHRGAHRPAQAVADRPRGGRGCVGGCWPATGTAGGRVPTGACGQTCKCCPLSGSW